MSKRKFSKEEFISAILSSKTIREVLGKLNITQKGSNYKGFYRAARAFDIDVSRFKSKNIFSDAHVRRTIKDIEIINAVKESISFYAVLKAFNLNTNTNANNSWIRNKIKSLGVDTSHFIGQAHLRGKTHNWNKKMQLSEILIADSQYLSTNNLKKRLLKEGLLKYECYECSIYEWRNQKLSLHLDHINGINDDNRIENLRLLCPNCHSLTPTYAGKNRTNRNKQLQTSNGQIKIIKTKCAECNKETHSNTSKVCKKCYNKTRSKYQDKSHFKTKIDWVSNEELLQMLSESNYTQVAKKLGVSDNAIRKRIKNHKS